MTLKTPFFKGALGLLSILALTGCTTTVTRSFSLNETSGVSAASLCRYKVASAGNDQINISKNLGLASLDDIKALGDSLTTIFDGEYQYVTVSGTARDDYFSSSMSLSDAFKYLLAVKSGERSFYLGYYPLETSYFYSVFTPYEGNYYYRESSDDIKAAVEKIAPILEAKGYGDAASSDLAKTQSAFIAAVFPF